MENHCAFFSLSWIVKLKSGVILSLSFKVLYNWVATWQKQQNELCAQRRDSDQPGHPPSLIRVFAVRMKKPRALNYLLSAQWRLIRLGRCPGWSESSLGARHFVGFVMWRLICSQETDICSIWATSCENVSYAISEQQRCRSACASAQSDQHLCCSLHDTHATMFTSKLYGPCQAKMCLWAFSTRYDSNRSAQLQRVARVLKFQV